MSASKALRTENHPVRVGTRTATRRSICIGDRWACAIRIHSAENLVTKVSKLLKSSDASLVRTEFAVLKVAKLVPTTDSNPVPI